MNTFPHYLQLDAMDCGPTCLRMIARYYGRNSLSFFFKYLLPYKRQIAHLLLGMMAVCLMQLIFPFLTQSLVDVGIRDGTPGFITLILTAQLVVSVSRLSVEFIRSWILLHMNTRINISL
ncbi:cysteine peptidase family C39 domain-containing protein, partial [Phocaeicola massiliensis]|uniref:cysteine peptidase family C39 domain-containing protein n=1 Tax=Phocaeicola massiliensis TaxID=204516 RepID=UPI0022E1F31D